MCLVVRGSAVVSELERLEESEVTLSWSTDSAHVAHRLLGCSDEVKMRCFRHMSMLSVRTCSSRFESSRFHPALCESCQALVRSRDRVVSLVELSLRQVSICERNAFPGAQSLPAALVPQAPPAFCEHSWQALEKH